MSILSVLVNILLVLLLYKIVIFVFGIFKVKVDGALLEILALILLLLVLMGSVSLRLV